MTRRLAPWVSDADLTDDPDLLNIQLPSGVKLADCCEASTDYLWRASGSRYDSHELTVRPSHLTDYCGASAGLLDPVAATLGHGLDWTNSVREIRLEGPASEIVVVVDGVELGEADWLLLDGYRLVRVGASWPCCQDLSRPNGDAGTWSVTYISGPPPPPLGRLAARELSKQIALYHSGRPSKLPAGTTSITRAGLTVNLDRPKRTNGGEAGTSGLPTVELFLDAVNPNRRRQGALVLSPDTLVGGRTS